jgi:hypothetical protein
MGMNEHIETLNLHRETSAERTERSRHASAKIRIKLEVAAIVGRLRLQPMKISDGSWSTADLADIRLALEWMTRVSGIKDENACRVVASHPAIAAVVGMFDFAIAMSRQGEVKKQLRHETIARRLAEEGIPKSVADEYG